MQQAGQAQAAGARGFGRLAAELGGGEAVTQGLQGQTGGLAQAQAAAAAQSQAQAQQGLAALLAQQEQSAMLAEQYRQERAKKGLMPIITGLGGAALGGYLGGPQGAQAGGQAGAALGGLMTR